MDGKIIKPKLCPGCKKQPATRKIFLGGRSLWRCDKCAKAEVRYHAACHLGRNPSMEAPWEYGERIRQRIADQFFSPKFDGDKP